MRRRVLILAMFAVLAAVAAVGLHGWRGPGATLAPRAAVDRGPRPAADLQLDGPMVEVLPLHKAVRRAARRFDGRVLDIVLAPATAQERGAGVQIVYRIRMLTSARDVLDIRMDALDGRFIEVRGADLGTARRTEKAAEKAATKKKEDD